MRSLLVIALVLFLATPVNAATRLAVLNIESPALAHIATFLELEFLKLPETETLERAKIDELLKEQVVQRAFSADAAAERVALGKILKADVLVLLQAVEKPKPHGNLIVFETTRGLRLQVQPFEITAIAANDATAILPIVKAALERARAEVREIVAVPPLVSNDLALERQALGKPLATVIEQMLLARPGVAVVELAEARAVAEEAALTASDGVSRKLPLYLLGEFRHDGYGADARMTISLSLKRGTTVVGSHTITDAAASEAAGLLRKEAAALFDKVSDEKAPSADPAAEAKELAERAKLMFRLGAWVDSVELAEASLLLKAEQFDLQCLIVDAVKLKMRTEYQSSYDKVSDAAKARGQNRYSINYESAREAVKSSNNALIHRALPHLEYFMIHTNLQYSSEMYALIGGFFGLCSGLDEEPPAMMVRVLKAKNTAKKNDGTFYFLVYCQQACFEKSSDEKKWQWKFAIAENWLSTDKNGASLSHLTGTILFDVNRDDPFLPKALKRLNAINNSEVQHVAGAIARRLEQGFQLFADIPIDRKPQAAPAQPKPTAVADPDIRFAMKGYTSLEPGEELAGWMPAGRGIDVAWTDDWLFFLRDKGQILRKDCVRIKYSVVGRCVCYDGRHVWAYRTAEGGKPELLVVDPATAHVETITAEHGLPPMALALASITALREGFVCVVGNFDGRAWIGLATFDPATGKRSLQVIHEALEQTVGKKGSAWKSTKTAFEWSKVYMLSGPPATDGTVPQRVFIDRFDSGNEHPLLVDPATHQVEVFESSKIWFSNDAVQHEGAMYWAGATPSGWRIHRFGFPTLKPEAYSQPIPEGTQLFRAGKLIGLQATHSQVSPDTIWVADHFSGQFRTIRLGRCEGLDMNSAKFCASEHFGTVAVRGRAWFEMHVEESAKADAAP